MKFEKQTQSSTDTIEVNLMSLGADASYCDWLLGRHMGERDRSPCYDRMKNIFVRRVHDDTGKKIMMPSPPWFSGSAAYRAKKAA